MTKPVEYILEIRHADGNMSAILNSSSPLGPFAIGQTIKIEGNEGIDGEFTIKSMPFALLYEGPEKIFQKQTIFIED